MFCQKLKVAKIKLKELNRLQYSNIQQRSSQARVKLHNIQAQLRDCLGNTELKEQERKALSDLVLFSSAMESLLRQKSRSM